MKCLGRRGGREGQTSVQSQLTDELECSLPDHCLLSSPLHQAGDGLESCIGSQNGSGRLSDRGDAKCIRFLVLGDLIAEII